MGTVLFYLVAALAMVMANKWVLNTTKVPLFFLDCQMIIAVILFLGAHMVGFVKLPLELDLQVCKGLIPMVGLNVIGLRYVPLYNLLFDPTQLHRHCKCSFSNYTLANVDASFYQVARGMVLPFTVFTSFFVLQARPSLNVLLACSVVTLGFFVGVFLDGTNVSLVGISFGVASSMITAVHSVVIKKALDVVKGSALHLSWYTNLISAICLIPVLVVVGEVPHIMELFSGSADVLLEEGESSVLTTFIWGSLITGVFGFLMSIASLLSIKVTSPITHMVSSAVRGVAASLLGKALFHEIITSGRASSIATILAGSIYYTWVKHVESHQAPPPRYEKVPLEEVEAGTRSSKPE